MKDEIVSFDTAKLAKEKGFNIHIEINTNRCNYYSKIGVFTRYGNKEWIEKYNYDYYPAPTQSLLQKWLREKHEIDIEIKKDFDEYSHYRGQIFFVRKGLQSIITKYFKTYEEALEQGLVEALKLIKE